MPIIVLHTFHTALRTVHRKAVHQSAVHHRKMPCLYRNRTAASPTHIKLRSAPYCPWLQPLLVFISTSDLYPTSNTFIRFLIPYMSLLSTETDICYKIHQIQFHRMHHHYRPHVHISVPHQDICPHQPQSCRIYIKKEDVSHDTSSTLSNLKYQYTLTLLKNNTYSYSDMLLQAAAAANNIQDITCNRIV